MGNMHFEDLLGKTLTRIEVGNNEDDPHIRFYCQDGSSMQMYHSQDCCENVGIEDINGDLDDLIGLPILQAEEVTKEDSSHTWGEGMWTFYKLATVKGYVTIRWYGESNGYYSISVDVRWEKP